MLSVYVNFSSVEWGGTGMSLSKILAKKSYGSENKVDVGSNNVINESSSEITNFEDEKEIPSFAVRMLNLGKELAIFCLIMLTYAAFTKE